jgi:hypothetical protein
MGKRKSGQVPEIEAEVVGDLLDAMSSFYRLSPWDWMLDGVLFAMRDPASGQIVYCCVLGNLGEVLGLVAYFGPEGYEYHQRALNGEWAIGDLEILHRLNCLQGFFEDREDLNAHDRALLTKAGFRGRGRKAWPSFRRFQPGLAPWHIAAEEAVLFTHALRQAAVVAENYRRNPKYLSPPHSGQMLLRDPANEKGALKWTDGWIDPPAVIHETFIAPTLDDRVVQRIKRLKPKQAGIWEFDFFHAPFAVQDGPRPYYPAMSFWVDARSGFVLDVGVCETTDVHGEICARALEMFGRNRMIPEEVRVKQEAARVVAETLGNALGFRVGTTRRLKAIEEARGALTAFMRFGG